MVTGKAAQGSCGFSYFPSNHQKKTLTSNILFSDPTFFFVLFMQYHSFVIRKSDKNKPGKTWVHQFNQVLILTNGT